MAPTPKLKPRPDDTAAAAVVDGLVKVKDVAGLDTASNRFHLYCNNGAYWAFHAQGDPDERRHQLYSRAQAVFGFLPRGTLLVCEEPLALQNGKTTRLLGLAAGALWAAHLEHSVFWAWADNSAWKRVVVGKGNAAKEETEAWVREHMGLEFDSLDSDLYDAAAICRWGEMAVGLA